MSGISCFALILATAVVSIASPTLAEPLNVQAGVTHLTHRRAVDSKAARHRDFSVQSSGFKGIARGSWNSFDPSLTGGGSIGYNESLIKDQ
jgi:hypothetical protein